MKNRPLFHREADFSHRIVSALLPFITEPSKGYALSIRFVFFALQISWVMVPMGQYTHQDRGLNKSIVSKPNRVEVSMTL